MAVADGAQIPILNEILKTNKTMSKSLLNGFSLLNKNLLNQTKAMTMGQKGIMTAVISMRKHAEGNAKTMVEGFGNLLDAERKALEFEKQEAIKEGLKDGENTREGGKKGLLGELPKGKDLIDPKKWAGFAKSFLMGLFSALSSLFTGLITTFLAPLLLGAFQGYYDSLVKAMKAPMKFLNMAIGTPIRFARDIIATISKGFLKLLDIILPDKLTAGPKKAFADLTAKITKAFDPLIKVFSNLETNLLGKSDEAAKAGTKVLSFVDKVKGFFNLSIFTTDIGAEMPKFADTPLGKFVQKMKNIWFKLGWTESSMKVATVADDLPKSPAMGFVDKFKNFFKLPDFATLGEKLKLPKFADTGMGKFIKGIKSLFEFENILGEGSDVSKLSENLKKAIGESSIVKMFKGVQKFFGLGGSKEPGPIQKAIEAIKGVFDFELPSGLQKVLQGIGKIFGKVFFIVDIFMGLYEAFKAFTTTEGTIAEKIVAAIKAFIDEVVFGLPNFLIEMVGKGISALLEFLGFGDAAKKVEESTKDFSIMKILEDSISKVWKWMKEFFGNLFNFENLSIEAMMPNFDFSSLNPLKMIGEKLSGILNSMAEGLNNSIVPGTGSLAKIISGLAGKVAKWGIDEDGSGMEGVQRKRSGGIVQMVSGDQVPAILHANEVVLAEQSAKLFLQAAQMFAKPEYINSIKDLVATNDQIKTQTTDAIMQAGAMQGGDGGTSAMIAQLAAQTEALGATMAQIPGAVQQGASSGARTGTSFQGFSKLSNPHEKKAK